MRRDDARPSDAERSPPFHLIALGASAGGLESLQRFFDTLTHGGPEAAWVVLMHLAPDRESALAHILADRAPLPVHTVADGDEIRAGRIHIPPPGTLVTVEGGHFRVQPRAEPTDRVIDALFASIASEWGEWSVGVVLSGAGDDGSRGISRLHDVGALTLAEDSSTARFDTMPRSATATGHVDRVGTPEVLAETVLRFIAGSADSPHDVEVEEIDIGPLLSLLLRERGRDFREYRASTVRRRIDRRRKLHRCDTIEEYTEFVREHEEELDELIGDLMISVTRFFRDPEAWDRIRETAVREVLDRKEDGDTVRIWVPGCATGEEAYSLTILFAEEIEERSLHVSIQVFATDIDPDSIETARRGVYPLAIKGDVPEGFLERHFDREGETYRVLKTDRQRIVFSVHDLLNDPPFAHMDLVSCRNLFIYLEPEVQRRGLSYLHYALDPGGFLVLGTSESIRGSGSLFEPVARDEKIFRMIEGSNVTDFRFPTAFTGMALPRDRADFYRSGTAPIELSAMARRILLRRYGPAAAVVNEERRIVYVLGDLGPYIQTPSGPLETRLMNLVRPDLVSAVRGALDRVEEDGARFVGDVVPLEIRGAPGTVRIAGYPVRPTEGMARHTLIVFEELEGPRPVGGAAGEPDAEESSGAQDLKAELVRARAEIRARDERKEAANEELRSANEELISMNEELQSMNEELSTAKEEFQSMNEELETINDELDHRVRELRRANSNMENLLASTQIATLFLDRDLRVLSHSSPATKLFNLIDSDRGRPLADISNSLTVTDLEGSMRQVLATLEPHQEIVGDASGRVFSLRILPYRTPTDVIDGLVVTLVDVTALKAAETRAGRLGAVVQVSKDPMIIVTTDGTIEVWNPGAAACYGYSTEEAVGMKMSRLVLEEDRDAFQELLARSAEMDGPTGMETRRVTKDGTLLEVWTTLTVIQEDGGPRVAFAERDVTERVRTARHRELLLRELDHRVKNTLATVQAIADRTLASEGSSPEKFVETFQGRLGALGRVHHELSEVRWGGLGLGRLVQRTLEPFVQGGKATRDGPRILLPVRITLPLAMALHELATNAAKYGALSRDDGHVEVSWTTDPEDHLHLQWQETGGPSVSEPDKRGFGMTFLERGLAYQIAAEVETNFGDEGFSCSIVVPLTDGGREDLVVSDSNEHSP
ncbi:MAG: CheR family methyltransferase [Longimicrobiales bacterium]|nr:CheR family methyltransferase [Longimicrobiales bacterium]